MVLPYIEDTVLAGGLALFTRGISVVPPDGKETRYNWRKKLSTGANRGANLCSPYKILILARPKVYRPARVPTNGRLSPCRATTQACWAVQGI